MIKNLLNADEDPPPGTRVVVEETVVNPSPHETENAPENTLASADSPESAPQNFEIPEDAQFFAKPPANSTETAPPLDDEAESLDALAADIENLDSEELDRLERELENAAAANSEPVGAVTAAPEIRANETIEPPANQTEIESLLADFEKQDGETSAAPDDSRASFPSTGEASKNSEASPEPAIFQSAYSPPSTAESIRNSGLAWSAGVVLFGSVIFMMIFGWFADLLFGSSPWGLVGGIILGGIIGFIQVFRISSQIYKK